MKIQYYSRLFKAETEEQYRARTILRFQKIVDKRRAKGEHVVFDVDIIQNDMDRWFTQKAKKNRDIKPQLEAYKTHEELHDAMRGFKSKAEIENDLKTGDFEHEGKELVLSFGIYKVFKTKDVKALTLLAQGSNWCVRYPNAAENYLVGQGSTFYIVLRGTDRFVAIRETEKNKPNVEVWWYTDYELRNGTNYAKFHADLIQEDLNVINQILRNLGFAELVPNKFKVYPDIETYVKYSRDYGQYARFLYNQRFYPDFANSLLTPGMRIKGDMCLSETGVTSLPENLFVDGSLDLDGTSLTSLPQGLMVMGSLDLSRTRITHLPKDLKVGQDLVLRGTPIQEIPAGLKLRGALQLSECRELTTVSEGVTVGSFIDLELCTKLTSLPNDLKVGEGMHLQSSAITSLPEGLEKVEGPLDLRGTPISALPKGLKSTGQLRLEDSSVTSLPENLRVVGDLRLFNTKITSLPKGLKVSGTLDLQYSSITSLPEGLEVGSMILNNTEITVLPKNLSVRESLTLRDTKITSLSEGIKIGESLYLDKTRITSLPADLKVGSLLRLNHTLITTLPEGFFPGGSISLEDCKNLTHLPQNLTIGHGYLCLASCPKLTSLPDNLYIPGSLNLGMCRGLKSLPENLTVGNTLYIDHTNITSLPESLVVVTEIIGRNPKTERAYHAEYEEMKARQKEQGSLRKLQVSE